MKKIISLIISAIILSSSVFAAPIKYSDPALLDYSEDAYFEPYPIKSNATRYTPWLTMYHMQRKVDADKGLRGGEGGQMIMSVGVSPVNPNLVLFGTDMGGLWRSIDGGDNWYSVTDNINMRAVMGIEFHPTKENLVYCVQGTKGTGLASRLARTDMDGLYRSTDGGRTWEQVLHKLFLTSACSQDLMKFDDEGNMYVLSREGVFKTTDDGENFTLLGEPDTVDADMGEDTEENPESDTDSNSGGVYSMWVSGDGKTIVTATGSSGVRYSTDGGVTWSTRNVSENTSSACSLTVDPKDPSHWYAIFSGESYRIYETKDCGLNWKGIKHYSYATKNLPMVIKAYYIKGSDKLRLHLVYNNMAHHYRYSDDNGATWKSPTNINSVTNDTFTGSTGYYTEGLEICESDTDIVFFSYGDILYKSTNGGNSFFWANAGYSGNYANDFVFDSKGRLWIPFTDRAMAVTDAPYTKGSYPTATKVISNATIGTVGIDPTNENIIYAPSGGWSDQTLYKSTDGGKNWAVLKDGVTGENVTFTSSCNVIHFHKDYESNGIIYAGKYKSTDRGNSWTKLDYNIWEVSPHNSDVLYSVNGSGGVVRSTDGGATWSVVKSKYSSPEVVKQDLFDENVFWIGCYSGNILRCTIGGGYTIIRPSNGLTPFGDAGNSVYSLAQNPKDPLHLIAGTNGPDAKTKTTGLFETFDGGTTWHVVKGLPSTRLVMTLEFTPSCDEVLIGTCSQGTMIYDYNVYKEYLAGTLKVDTSDEILLANNSDRYRVRFEDEHISFSDAEAPYMKNDEVYFPFEKLISRTNYEYSINKEDGGFVFYNEYLSYSAKADSNTIVVNGEEKTLVNAPEVRNNILFVPVSFFDSIVELEADYDDALRRVNLKEVPVCTVTYKFAADSDETEKEYLNSGDSIILKSDIFKRSGYEISHWTDENGNRKEIGDTIAVNKNTVYTAVWVRKDNVAFFHLQDNTYYPEAGVVITDNYNTETESYNYTVNYSSHYSTGTLSICDNAKISSDTKRDRRYIAYKVNLAQMGEFESAKLRFCMSKVNNGGYFYVYGSDGKWEDEFGDTGVSYGESETFAVRDSLPNIGSKIAQSTIKTSTTESLIDITDYLLAKKEKGEEYAIVYVIYHMTNTGGRTNFDGVRLYNMGSASTHRPQLIVNEFTKTEAISSPGKILAKADIAQRSGTPVIAWFTENADGSLNLQNISVGTSTTDVTKKIAIDVNYTEGQKPVVKFFVWDSNNLLSPLISDQIIQ